MNKLISKGKEILTSPQTSVFSAATIIMVMIVAARALGLVQKIILAHFFTPEEVSLFFAAFRLPDLIFEVLVFGSFSSAFIPVFTKSLREDEKKTWDIAGRVVNIALLLFIPVAAVFSFFAGPIYSVIAPGFTPEETKIIANLARVLFGVQAIFVVSYVLTGVLESSRRFLAPALAPVFYNLGIILATLFLSSTLGLMAPVIGSLLGAALHFAVQFPLATKLGFRFVAKIKPTPEVKKIGKLAAPRVVDLSFQQIAKTAELYFASLISTASYAYYTYANSLQLLPVSLFGLSLAKAALPTLSRQDDKQGFNRILFNTFYQVVFLTIPIAAILIVLRVPLVRILFGRQLFDWEATVQTAMTLSAFAVGIVFQAVTPLLARGFYALHDTKTPVAVSVVGIIVNVLLNFLLVSVFGLPVWALAASFSATSAFQAVALYCLINRKLEVKGFITNLVPVYKSVLAATIAGGVMYFVLKFFDRAVWVKRLPLLGGLKAPQGISFEGFVFDTRYVINLLLLSAIVSAVGIGVYLVTSLILGSQELKTIIRLIKRGKLAPLAKEPEPITST